MKFYMRNADAALAGMAELTLEQCGLYNRILDLIYSRDGVVPADEACAMLRIDPRAWRRITAELMAKGKVRVDSEGMLCANGVSKTLTSAEIRSRSQRSSADLRWKNYKLSKENNVIRMPLTITNTKED
jgi:uncharacterized protein YdaU (DUF1376 family)